jgi:hypothetical protein
MTTMMGLLSLSFHYNSRERSLQHLGDNVHTADELKTGWLFLHHPCHQSQSTDRPSCTPGELDNGCITGEKRGL